MSVSRFRFLSKFLLIRPETTTILPNASCHIAFETRKLGISLVPSNNFTIARSVVVLITVGLGSSTVGCHMAASG